MGVLSMKAWSPYAAGMVIGLLQIPAFLLVGTALGTSSSYVSLTANAAALVDPAVQQMDYMAKHLSGAKNWWQVAMVIGVALGAMLSARLAGQMRSAPSEVWQRAVPGLTERGRMFMAFGGGFLMVFGARVADGCTTGHGISGMAQLAAGSFVAVAAMFAGGIAAAGLLYRKV